MISAIVLAAGLSSRMGALKQLLPYGERSVVEQVVTVLLSCSIEDIVVVLGHRHAEIRAALEKYPVRVALNTRYHEEMLTSIQRGWSEAHRETAAVMHVLGDQPHLEARIVQQIIAAYRAEHRGIFVPSFNQRRGHPVLLDAGYRAEILALDETKTMRDFMREHAAEIRHLNVDTDSILRDMDTPAEYEREIKLRVSAP